MAKTNITFSHNIIPPISGGTTYLSNAFSTMAVGASNEYPVSSTAWPRDGTRMFFQPYTGLAAWDATNSRIVWVAKQANGLDGAIHWFDDTTGLWTQKWRGWFAADSSGVTDAHKAHPYNSWCLSPTDQTLWIYDWESNIRKWHGNTTLKWDLQYASSAIPNLRTVPASSGDGTRPFSMVPLANAFSGSEEGFLFSCGRYITCTKRDASAGSARIYIEPIYNLGAYPTLHTWEGTQTKAIFSTGPQAKNVADPFNNAAVRATASVKVYVITATGTGTPTIQRLQDAPSRDVSTGNGWGGTGNGDRLVAFGSTIYIFEGAGTGGIWKYDFTSATWGKMAYTHKTQEGNLGNSSYCTFSICGITSMGGVVTITESDPSHSSLTSQYPRMYLTKLF